MSASKSRLRILVWVFCSTVVGCNCGGGGKKPPRDAGRMKDAAVKDAAVMMDGSLAMDAAMHEGGAGSWSDGSVLDGSSRDAAGSDIDAALDAEVSGDADTMDASSDADDAAIDAGSDAGDAASDAGDDECNFPSLVCGSVCIDAMNDMLHCGATACSGVHAGATCDAIRGQSCLEGMCTPMTWGSEMQVSNLATGRLHDPAIDPQGATSVLWTREIDLGGPITHEVTASRFDSIADAWLAGELLELEVNAVNPGVSMEIAADGDVVVAWSRTPSPRTAWFNRRDFVSGMWGTAQAMQVLSGGSLSDVAVVAGPRGDLAVTWAASTSYSTSGRIFDALEESWTDPVHFDPTGEGGSELAAIAFDGAGNLVAVWMEGCMDSICPLFARWFEAATDTWGDAVPLDGDGTQPRVGVDDHVNAIAIWHQDGSVRAGRYAADTGTWQLWSDSILSQVRSGYHASLAVTPQGDAVAVAPCNGVLTSVAVAMAAHYDHTTGSWSAPQRIDGGGQLGLPRVAGIAVGSDRAGNVIAAYTQEFGSYHPFATRFDAEDQQWSTPQRLDPSTSEGISASLAVGKNGHAIVTWLRANRVMASIYR